MAQPSVCPDCGAHWPEALRRPLKATWKGTGITCPTCRTEKRRRQMQRDERTTAQITEAHMSLLARMAAMSEEEHAELLRSAQSDLYG